MAPPSKAVTASHSSPNGPKVVTTPERSSTSTDPLRSSRVGMASAVPPQSASSSTVTGPPFSSTSYEDAV